MMFAILGLGLTAVSVAIAAVLMIAATDQNRIEPNDQDEE